MARRPRTSTLAPRTRVRIEAVDNGALHRITGDDYIDRYWLPLLGPSCVSLLRFIEREDGHVHRLGDVAGMVGLGLGLGSFHRVVLRLQHFHYGDLILDPNPDDGDNLPGILRGHVALPELSDHRIAKLPELLRLELRRAKVPA